MGGYLGQNRYRESQIFEVQQAYPCTLLAKVTPWDSTRVLEVLGELTHFLYTETTRHDVSSPYLMSILHLSTPLVL